MISQKKILVVEDNEINRAMLSEILSSEYQVLEAENGGGGSGCAEGVWGGDFTDPAGHHHACHGRLYLPGSCKGRSGLFFDSCDCYDAERR